MSVKIAHAALWTADLETSAAFWSRYFDATIGERYESRRRPGFASRFVELDGGPSIELMTRPWVPEDIARAGAEVPGWAHVAVSVGSHEAVDALARRLDEDGLLVSQPRITGDGYYEAVATNTGWLAGRDHVLIAVFRHANRGPLPRRRHQ
ncbi:VOC family protein [Mesorhizobium muleiense]|uniref:VOC family protein n=1 Tax=Mesorhizobium muleiense TaxID=1004279 RepID=UPI001F3940BE|nr:VOC family protein [Mesorhizobium muleiense]MCF6113140.1 VOC family protein [Mesorhizobium muleiense]